MKENNYISKSKINLFQRKIMKWFEGSGRHYLPWRKEGLTSNLFKLLFFLGTKQKKPDNVG